MAIIYCLQTNRNDTAGNSLATNSYKTTAKAFVFRDVIDKGRVEKISAFITQKLKITNIKAMTFLTTPMRVESLRGVHG